MRNRHNACDTSPRNAPVLRLLSPVVVLGRSERWCSRCGESMMPGSPCPRCDSREYVDPKGILHPNEYVVL